MSEKFSGKVVLVAGGTGALGRAVSLAFLRAGAVVAVTYRKQHEFDALARDASTHGARLHGHVADATDERAVAQLIAQVIEQQGPIDALVNTIGGYAGGVNLWETPAGLLDQMLTLNLRSGYALARAAIPWMLARGRGAIVNTAAKAALDAVAGAAAYAASKSAALVLFDALAAEVKGKGLRVNTVLPGIIDTPANRSAMPQADFPAWPKPDEIARVILFLCSDDASVIHGAAIPVYGNR